MACNIKEGIRMKIFVDEHKPYNVHVIALDIAATSSGV
jgi:hypothetical protein